MITICDTGPLVVSQLQRPAPCLGRRAHEAGARSALDLRTGLLRSRVFLREDDLPVDPVFHLIEHQVLRLDFNVSMHWPRIRTLMTRYQQMDLADASLVVMSEINARSQVLTVDRKDLSVYRRNDRQVIEFIAPTKR